MRDQKEMLALIVKKAKEEEHIRAALLQGSRIAEGAKADCFQDYDIVYLVDDLSCFLSDNHWVDYYGDRIIMQLPDYLDRREGEAFERFTYLMQFTDGNRIDLTLVPVENRETDPRARGMVLLDKDGLYETPPKSEEKYWVRRPERQEFLACCNEFWWVSVYVAKGLWRNEVLYAQAHLNDFMRPMLMKMLDWYIGINTDFSVSTGKCGRFLNQYLEEKSWVKLLKTYPDSKRENIWEALFSMCCFFHTAGEAVGKTLGYEYPQEDDQRVQQYLRHIYTLPCDVKEIY